MRVCVCLPRGPQLPWLPFWGHSRCAAVGRGRGAAAVLGKKKKRGIAKRKYLKLVVREKLGIASEELCSAEEQAQAPKHSPEAHPLHM